MKIYIYVYVYICVILSLLYIYESYAKKLFTSIALSSSFLKTSGDL